MDTLVPFSDEEALEEVQDYSPWLGAYDDDLSDSMATEIDLERSARIVAMAKSRPGPCVSESMARPNRRGPRLSPPSIMALMLTMMALGAILAFSASATGLLVVAALT